MKLVRELLAMCVFTLVVAGCAAEQQPWPKLEPVKGFSLGSAKFTPFKKRPTAWKLYRTIRTFYDSFESDAASYRSRNGFFIGSSRERGRPIRWNENSWVEMRDKQPDKWLTSVHYESDFPWISSITVQNGGRLISYSPGRGTFVAEAWKHTHRSVADWITGTSANTLMTGLSEQLLGNTEVYVLEWKIPAKRYGGRNLPAATGWLFIGKKDLLPRRWEMESANDIYRKDYAGFVANPDLPDDLFPTKPPKGAKPGEGGEQ